MKAVASERLRLAMASNFGGLLNDAQFCLVKADVNPGPFTSSADLVEANFDGYSRVDITTFTGFVDAPTGLHTQALGNILLFEAGTAALPQTCYCWKMLDAEDNMLLAGRFDVPKQINGPADAIVMEDPLLTIPLDTVQSLRSL